MKTLKQIRENYDDTLFLYVELDSSHSEMMLEGRDQDHKEGLSSKKISRASPIPSSKEMPTMLVFRRVQYRVFPNNQVVALYYSNQVDKYLSIPFGPHDNLNMSEAVIHEEHELDEDWQKVNRHDKTDGLSQKAVNAYRREHPGSKLKTAVTEKNPKGKRAARRKSFCSRMGGMKKRLTSAKTARDPDSNINKALRRWNCEESFRAKLTEMRMQNEGIVDWAAKKYDEYKKQDSIERDNAGAKQDYGWKENVPGYVDQKKAAGNWKKGNYGQAIKYGARSIGKKVMTAAGLGAVGLGAAGAVGTTKSAVKTATTAGAGAVAGGVAGNAVKAAAKFAANPLGDNPHYLGKNKAEKPEVATQTSWNRARPKYNATNISKINQADVLQARSVTSHQKRLGENKMSDLREMVDNGVEFKALQINGREVNINIGMAKRILEVYDSVNSKNKKIVESMLNENLESFKKLLNFSIRN